MRVPFPVMFSAVGLGAVSIYLAVAHPRPSVVPQREPVVSIACAELPRLMERTARQGYSTLASLSSGEIARPSDRVPYLSCGGRAFPIAFGSSPPAPRGRSGELDVRIMPDRRLVVVPAGDWPLGPDGLSPRADAEDAHRLGLVLGWLAVLLGLCTWAGRAVDRLRDLVGARAPRRAAVLEARSDDRLRVIGADGTRAELAHRVLMLDGGTLRAGRALDGPHIGLPGATPRYREAAGGEAYVQGPAKVNGLRVAARATTPLFDGDVVELGAGPSIRIELPEPGRALRYLAGEGGVRLVQRVSARTAWVALAATAVLGLAAVVLLHADLVHWHLYAGLMALGTLAAARAIPPQLAERVETCVPLASLLDGSSRLELRDEGEEGRAILVDGATAARLPTGGKDLLERASRAALEAALDREVAILSSLGERDGA